MTTKPKIGDTVRFTGRTEVAWEEAGPATWTGLVNGEPITDDEGTVVYVPVWCERDHGREPTTIMVAVENIIAVERPSA